jgi:hypothetical protein
MNLSHKTIARSLSPPVFSRLLLLLAVGGCTNSTRATRDRGAAGVFENVPVMKSPPQTRCARLQQTSSLGKSCLDAVYLAQLYARRLATGDEVCLEGGFGERSTRDCLARAAVMDVNTNLVLMDVREARPNSKWFGKESNQFWFEEGALVDMYLVDHGY